MFNEVLGQWSVTNERENVVEVSCTYSVEAS